MIKEAELDELIDELGIKKPHARKILKCAVSSSPQDHAHLYALTPSNKTTAANSDSSNNAKRSAKPQQQSENVRHCA